MTVRVLGIDEAGRGCVLGPLVVGAYLYEGPEEALWEAGARDSKRLSPRRRLAIRAKLERLGQVLVRRIEPEAIDRESLNVLEEAAIAELVRETAPDHVLLDALGPPSALPSVVRRLRSASGSQAAWLMEPKADARHAVVAAASIVAKTTRDAALDDLLAAWGPLGSGYPSDPKTRAWLQAWAATDRPWPSFVRTKWQTVRDLR